jgi:O-acetylserine/cysteine efflux transporter
MPIKHILLALLVVLIWGINFIFVTFALQEIPPILLCALRFFIASVPAVLFVRLPKSAIKTVICYGLVMFALQFSFVFIGMSVGMTAGVASLLMQVQVFFSMFFAVLFLDEQPRMMQVIGALVSFIGIGVVALHFDANVSLLGFVCILAAAATWGFGNLIAKKMNTTHFSAVIVWGSFVACVPMFLISLIVDGPNQIAVIVTHVSFLTVCSVFYIVFASTWVAYGVWNWLLSRHLIGSVVPFTLLVPVVGILSSMLLLGEPFYLWKLVSALLVILGLCINLMSGKFFRPRVLVG